MISSLLDIIQQVREISVIFLDDIFIQFIAFCFNYCHEHFYSEKESFIHYI